MTVNEPIYLLNRRLKLHQPADGFRTSIDAVLLAAFCPAKAGQSLLDMGCGTGAAGFCVLARVEGVSLHGVDIQGDHIALAQKNATLNDLQEVCMFTQAHIGDFTRYKADGTNAPFDHIICNPPYNEAAAHTPSPSSAKALAMGHADTDLADWVACANRNLKSGGSFTLIHKAAHIDKILQTLGPRFGAVEILPLYPHAGQEARRVIIRALKGRKTPARLFSGLILHTENGDYTPEAQDVLRDLAAL
ncbi:MAG: methyltransferase [Alphaproteobacteria bacterium]|nr:methyltransferase [Alphaproteobacteria bacterium]